MSLHKIIKQVFIVCLSIFLSLELSAQTNDSAEVPIRFFMPALQIGYINHNSDAISEGLVI